MLPDGGTDGAPGSSPSLAEEGMVAAGGAPPGSPSAGAPTLPLRSDEGVRHLVGAGGQPFLLHGEAAWSLIVELDREEVDAYIANRRQYGFNAVMVSLIEHQFSSNPPNNAAGDAPFATPGDFSMPNEAYFQHADWVLERLAAAGFVVLLTPAYAGWEGATTRQLRTQAYQAVFGGASGHVFGNNPIWHFDGPGVVPTDIRWQDALDGPGSRSMGALARITSALAWWELVPDLDRSLVVDGNGKDNDEVAAAIAEDRSWAVAYVPSERTMTFDLSQLDAGAKTITWIDPATGEPAFGTTTSDPGRVRFETPGRNADDDGDWILTVTAS